jgi:hypothetical protein
MTVGWDANLLAAGGLLAFGIVAPFPAFTGGMLLALGSCYAVRAYRAVEGRKGLGLSLFSAVLAAMIVAGLNGATSVIPGWGTLPLQMQMAAGGLFSQAMFEVIAARDTRLAGKIADWVGLKRGSK